MIFWFTPEGHQPCGALSAIMPEGDFGVACDDLYLAVDNDMTGLGLVATLFWMAR
jgi:hypothetical protein